MCLGRPNRCQASDIPPILPGESNALALSKARISRFCARSDESSIVLISCKIVSSVPELGMPPFW